MSTMALKLAAVLVLLHAVNSPLSVFAKTDVAIDDADSSTPTCSSSSDYPSVDTESHNLNLAKAYMKAGFIEKAYKSFQTCAATMGQVDEKFYAQYQAGRMAVILDEPEGVVKKEFLAASAILPTRAEPLLALSEYFRGKSMYDKAYEYAMAAKDLAGTFADSSFVDQHANDWRTLDEICTAAYYVGKHSEGRSACALILQRFNEGAYVHIPEEDIERIKHSLTFYSETNLGEENKNSVVSDDSVRAYSSATTHGHHISTSAIAPATTDATTSVPTPATTNMASLSFYMMAHKQPNATAYSLQSVRKYYPDSIILVFENGSNELAEICKTHNAKHIQQPVNYIKPRSYTKWANMHTIDDMQFFMEMLHKVSKFDTEWAMLLEPDVVLRNKIESFPSKSIGGHMHAFNTFDSSVHAVIDRKRKNVGAALKDTYIFSGAGGSVIRVADLRKVLQHDWISDVKPSPFSRGFGCGDEMLSYLFYIYGFDIEDWDQYCEVHETKDMLRLTLAPVVHGFKYFYE